MELDLQTIVGLISSALTTLSLIPQLVKVAKEKKAEGISLFMLFILFTGLVGWIYYGVLKADWILIISNSVSLLINSIIVTLALKYKNT